MLREPRRTEKLAEVPKKEKNARFQLLKLEERIAPRGKGGGGCHTNPHGKKVGNCGGF